MAARHPHIWPGMVLRDLDEDEAYLSGQEERLERHPFLRPSMVNQTPTPHHDQKIRQSNPPASAMERRPRGLTSRQSWLRPRSPTCRSAREGNAHTPTTGRKTWTTVRAHGRTRHLTLSGRVPLSGHRAQPPRLQHSASHRRPSGKLVVVIRLPFHRIQSRRSRPRRWARALSQNSSLEGGPDSV